jgi:hypothetical protein
MGLKGARFATVEDIKSNATVELRKIPKEASAGASSNGRLDEARMYARKGHYFEGYYTGKRCRISYHYSIIHHFGKFLTGRHNLVNEINN